MKKLGEKCNKSVLMIDIFKNKIAVVYLQSNSKLWNNNNKFIKLI